MSGITGISVWIEPDNELSCYAVKLVPGKKNWQPEIKHNGPVSIDALPLIIQPGSPVALTIDGKGVIHRKITPAIGEDPVASILPDAGKIDLLVQKVPLTNGEVFVSLIRKKLTEQLIEKLSMNGYRVILCTLGPFAILKIADILDEDTFYIPHWEVSNSGNGISFKPQESAMNLQSVFLHDFRIPAEYLCSYATAVQLHNHSIVPIQVQWEVIRNNYKEEAYRIRSKRTVLVSIIALFILLLGNAVIFHKLSIRKNFLAAELISNRKMIQQLDSLQNEFVRKKRFFSQSSFFENIRYSLFADNIAAKLSSDIILTRMEFNPPVTKPKPEQEIKFNQKTCIISGKVKNGVIFNQWLNILRKESWLKEVEVLDYRQEDSSSPAQFSIQIKVKQE